MAKDWVEVTEAAMNNTRAAALVEALRTAALAEEQADPVDELIGDIVNEVRSAIAMGYGISDAASATSVPASLLRMVSRMVIWEAKGRLELDRAFDEPDHREDLRRMDRLRSGKEPLVQPDEVESAPVASAAAVAIAGSRVRVANQGGVDGLL